MRQVFIAKDLLYGRNDAGSEIASIHVVDTLMHGAICFFDDRNVKINAATNAAALADSSQFFLALGEAGGGTRISSRIDRRAYVRKKTVPVTGIARVDTLGVSYNLPSTLVAGSVASVTIRRDNFMEEDSPLNGRQVNIQAATRGIRVEDTVRAGDTDVTLMARIIVMINAHPDNDEGDGTNWITAASVGATGATLGMTLTVNRAGQEFNVSTDGILVDATLTHTTATTYPRGTAVQVAEVEAHARIEEGDSNRLSLPSLWFNKASEVVAGATYTAYEWEWKNERRNSIGTDNASSERVTLFVPSGAATLIALLDAAFAVVHVVGIDDSAGETEANI